MNGKNRAADSKELILVLFFFFFTLHNIFIFSYLIAETIVLPSLFHGKLAEGRSTAAQGERRGWGVGWILLDRTHGTTHVTELHQQPIVQFA